MDFVNSEWFPWIGIPILIFCARIVDVTIGTLRIVYIARGQKIIAPILGFFETIIWLLAIGQIFKHLDNWACYFAWAAGFAMGNFLGMVLEQKLAIGMQVIRIITRMDANELITYLNDSGYGISAVDGTGPNGSIKIIFMLIKRKDLEKITSIVHKFNPKAFYTVEDVQFANDENISYPLSTKSNKSWRGNLKNK